MNADRSRLLSGCQLALAAVLVSLLSACSLPQLSAHGLDESEQIVTDTGKFTASYRAVGPAVAAGLSEAAAIERAHAVLSEAPSSASPQARRLLMTLESETGDIVTSNRDAWLIKYTGREFTPELGCACYIVTWPDTNVALDAQTGELLFIFGSGTPAS